MKYKIALRHDEEGYSVSVPGLPVAGRRALPKPRLSRTLLTRFYRSTRRGGRLMAVCAA